MNGIRKLYVGGIALSVKWNIEEYNGYENKVQKTGGS